jgi:gamma-glutamylcyclotransferase (GGCT)/AIG2-like uncharacterized protein YtfP
VKPTGDRLLQPNSTNSGQPARLSVETNKLFVYGTLRLDDVISAVIGRIPYYQNAVAPGWQVVCLPERVYPGLIPGQGEALGKVFTDLTDTEWATLDAFEDPAYTLTTVRVLLSSKTEMDALSYVWRGEHIDQSWSVVDFGRDELTNYLDRCHNWRRRYQQRTS